VAWDTYAVNGVIQDDKMSRMREVVEWILAADMYCVVNIHWDGGWIRSDDTPDQYRLTNEVRAKFQSYWEQISQEFVDVGNRLVFEAMNEEGVFYVNGNESDGLDYAPLGELNQLFVNTVRAAGGANGTRNLLISGFATDIEKTCVDAFTIPSDPAGPNKLFLSVHYYTPYVFTLMEEPADWGGMVYPSTTWGTEADRAELQTLFDTLAAFSSARNTPIILGEFGVSYGTGEYLRESASRVLWMKSVIETAMSRGMVPVLWDTGWEISRTDGSFSPDFAQVMTELGL
jgi:endoglucanase